MIADVQSGMKESALSWQPAQVSKRVLWVKPRPDYESLFSIMGDLREDEKRNFWIEGVVTQGNNRDIEADTGQMSTSVEIQLPMSHNDLRIDAARRCKITPLTGAQPPHNPQLD